jgi:hypothetical protein
MSSDLLMKESLRKMIAIQMRDQGPRATIVAMRNALMVPQAGAPTEQIKANTRCARCLTEILKHWKDEEADDWRIIEALATLPDIDDLD